MIKQTRKKTSVSIGFKLTLTLISIVSLITISTSIILFGLMTIKSNTDFKKKTDQLFTHSKKDIVLPLWNLNYPLISRICTEHIKAEEIVLLKILDHKARLIFQSGNIEETDFTRESQISHKGETIGSITMGFNKKAYNAHNRHLLLFSFITLFFVVLGLSMSTGLVIQKIFRKPMELMFNRIQQFKNGQYEIILTDIQYTEVQSILTAFNKMGMEIKKREALLKSEIIERQKKERQYRLLAENMEDVIWTMDPSKKITYISPSITQLRGYTQEEAMKQTLREKNIQKGYQLLEQNLTDSLEKGKPFIIEYKQPCKDGSTVWVESHIKPLFDKSGKPIEFIGVSRNISFRKNAEAKQKKLEEQLFQAQKMEAIGMLASGISHDFNNILGGILGFSQLLLEDLKAIGDTGKMERWANNVIDCSFRAKDLVAQILAFTRSHEEKVFPVNLAIIVKEVAKLLKSTIPSTIQINVSCMSDAKVLSDATKIHQVIMNLCTNAAYAMKESGGLLSITLEDLPNTSQGENSHISKDVVVLSVEDTGHGMDEETIKNALAPLFTTKPVGEGTGLGLSVVNDIVKEMDGNIQISSKPGKGSRFDIFLPVFNHPIETDSPIKRDEAIHRGRGNILFVDDEATLTKLAQEILTSLGYQVATFNSSVEALAHFKLNHKNFDLVITDLTMPEITGDMLCEEIRRIRPIIPTLLITGNLEAENLKNMKLFDSILKKPVPIEKLAGEINKLLKKYR